MRQICLFRDETWLASQLRDIPSPFDSLSSPGPKNSQLFPPPLTAVNVSKDSTQSRSITFWRNLCVHEVQISRLPRQFPNILTQCQVSNSNLTVNSRTRARNDVQKTTFGRFTNSPWEYSIMITTIEKHWPFWTRQSRRTGPYIIHYHVGATL